jgi:hypothetical protein
MLTLEHITFDCADAAGLANFWSQALTMPVDDGASVHVATIGAAVPGPTFMFLAVEEGKTAKNRCHLDLKADDRAAEAKRLVSLGATYLSEHDEWGHQWIVLRDPAGNEFCIS